MLKAKELCGPTLTLCVRSVKKYLIIDRWKVPGLTACTPVCEGGGVKDGAKVNEVVACVALML